MQGGEGGRACDFHRGPGPSLTPVYNSSPGIRGTANLGSFPPEKKRSENLFHSVARLSDPVLERVAREKRWENVGY